LVFLSLNIQMQQAVWDKFSVKSVMVFSFYDGAYNCWWTSNILIWIFLASPTILICPASVWCFTDAHDGFLMCFVIQLWVSILISFGSLPISLGIYTLLFGSLYPLQSGSIPSVLGIIPILTGIHTRSFRDHTYSFRDHRHFYWDLYPLF
jgi:hypothetical protein